MGNLIILTPQHHVTTTTTTTTTTTVTTTTFTTAVNRALESLCVAASHYKSLVLDYACSKF
ncbi:hypothetical protein E2C01_068229 [Portunus trituberculatus]|uniref:Uncharacterized protein n=1 Tax=Portunus trituberculatus TaxID=210409 RepID=A0A5B7HYV0_PORTR|nr:hypothetical protein [Portunus trituberculatus]